MFTTEVAHGLLAQAERHDDAHGGAPLTPHDAAVVNDLLAALGAPEGAPDELAMLRSALAEVALAALRLEGHPRSLLADVGAALAAVLHEVAGSGVESRLAHVWDVLGRLAALLERGTS